MSNGHNGSNGHNVQWTRCPMDTMFNGHDAQWIQWTQCSIDTMFNGHDVQCTQDVGNRSNGSNGHVQWCSMDPLDKNTKLMVTRQTRFGDCVHWIHSDGSLDIH